MQQSSGLVYEVNKLITKPTGSKEDYDINVTPHFEGEKDIQQGERMTAQLILRNIPDGIHAEVRNLNIINIPFQCVRCMRSFTQNITVPQAGAQFYFEKPPNLLIEEEIFFIDKKKLTIDLREMLRQEILLHFPSVPVCSKSCKGLCKTCAQNLNQGSCMCSHKEIQEDKPLHHLKKLLS